MLNNDFKSRYREIPLAYCAIEPAEFFSEKTETAIMHFHEEIEVIHITDGAAEIYIDGEKFDAAAGETYFISPMVSHRVSVLPGMFGYYCICFDGSLLGNREEVVSIIEGREKIAPKMVSDQVAESVKNIVKYCSGNDKGRSYRIIGELYKIFGEIIESGLIKNVSKNTGGEFALKVYQFIKNRFHEQITSADCAESFYMDHSSFCRKFRKCFGTSFSRYLCSYRLEKARQMLEEGNRSITELSSATGFAGTSYFIMKFRQTYGVTPKKSYKKTDIL